MRMTVLLLFVLSSISSNAQTNQIDSAFEKVKLFYKQNNAYGQKTEIYLNKDQRILSINWMEFPLEVMDIKYDFVEPKANSPIQGHYVELSCIKKDCVRLVSSDYKVTLVSGNSFAFKTAKDCYEFIDLLFNLKRALSY